MKTTTRRKGVVMRVDDAGVLALLMVLEALAPLSRATRSRVLDYVLDQWEEEDGQDDESGEGEFICDECREEGRPS